MVDESAQVGSWGVEQPEWSTGERGERTLSPRSYVRLLVFLAVLSVCYIWLRNYHVKLWRLEQGLEEEVTNLHYESTTISADLMLQGRESEVAKLAKIRGLKIEESRRPPVKVTLARR